MIMREDVVRDDSLFSGHNQSMTAVPVQSGRSNTQQYNMASAVSSMLRLGIDLPGLPEGWSFEPDPLSLPMRAL